MSAESSLKNGGNIMKDIKKKLPLNKLNKENKSYEVKTLGGPPCRCQCVGPNSQDAVWGNSAHVHMSTGFN